MERASESSKALSLEASEPRVDGFLTKSETAPDIHAALKSGKSSVEITGMFRKDSQKENSENAAMERKFNLALEQSRRLSSQNSTSRISRFGRFISSSGSTQVSSYATVASSSPPGTPSTLANTIYTYESGTTMATLVHSLHSAESQSLPPTRVNYEAPESDGRGMTTAATVLMFATDIAAVAAVPFLGKILALSVDVVVIVEVCI